MAKRLREDIDSSDTESTNEDLGSKSRSLSQEPIAHTPKYVSLDTPQPDIAKAMRCLLPPHKPLRFHDYPEYELHYEQLHTNRCADCKKNFPTSHFLDLHISENHDPITAAKRDAGEKTFACFVEGCEKVCREWTKRRSHLLDKHGYPKNYDFLLVNHGIDGRRSMLRAGVDAQGHRRSSRERERSDSNATEMTQSTEATSTSDSSVASLPAKGQSETVEEETIKSRIGGSNGNINMENLTSSMSSLNMVPRSITFGKRKGRSGFAKS